MSEHSPLRFADHVENIAASNDNPIKRGRFVRVVKRTGKLNPGTFVEYIDDRGNTHLTPPDNIRRIESVNLLPELVMAAGAAAQAIQYSIEMGRTDPGGVLLQALNKINAALSKARAGAPQS